MSPTAPLALHSNRRLAAMFMCRILLLLYAFGPTMSCSDSSSSGSSGSTAAVVLAGAVRVTAMSPALVRIERVGPLGFTDNTTFFALNRTAFAGVPLRTLSANASDASLATEFYSFDLSVRTTQNGSTVISATVSRGNDSTATWVTRDLTAVSASLRWPAPPAALLPHRQSAYAIKDFPRFSVPPWGPTPMPADAKAHLEPALLATNGYDFRGNIDGDVYVFLGLDTLDGWAEARKHFITLTGPSPVLPDWAFGVWYTRWYPYNESFAKAEISNWTTHNLPLDVWGLGERRPSSSALPVVNEAVSCVATLIPACFPRRISRGAENAADMNWRNTPHGHAANVSTTQAAWDEKHYDSPNTELFPDLAIPKSTWFDWIKAQGLRTYFNDHPSPANNGTALQTSPEEVEFRWDGLTQWMDSGLTYWWYDANWGVSIPPPNVDPVPCRKQPGCDPHSHGATGSWDGMTNIVWGSHVYYEIMSRYVDLHPQRREHSEAMARPLTLTKFANGRHGHPTGGTHPAGHRYPVHWTGDSVSLSTTVGDMINAGINYMQYVHSDCGSHVHAGQDNATAADEGGDNIRWTAMCTFSGIFRYHAGNHVPWRWGAAIEDTIRTYLNMRAKLQPALVAGSN
jgi:hypothetical protein